MKGGWSRGLLDDGRPGVTSPNGMRDAPEPLLGGPTNTNLARQFLDYMGRAKNEEMGRSLFGAAQSNFPVLNNYPLQFQYTPKDNGAGLEFWPAGEPGAPGWERPQGFDMARPGVEVFSSKVTPRDIMGDAASHYLNEGRDPTVTSVYTSFKDSLTDKQRRILQEQYQYARNNFNERRSYEDWEQTSGLPAAFRGYAFKQWPDEFNNNFYTTEQKRLFDAMNTYLQGPPRKR